MQHLRIQILKPLQVVQLTWLRAKSNRKNVSENLKSKEPLQQLNVKLFDENKRYKLKLHTAIARKSWKKSDGIDALKNLQTL